MQLLELIDENIDTLRESLANFQRIPERIGLDNMNDEYRRKTKKEFIEKTKQDLDYMLNLRKKFIEVDGQKMNVDQYLLHKLKQ